MIDWTLRVTRGLPADVACDRFEQIVSDLWEQGHASDLRHRSGLRLAASTLLRAARGVPADLRWRREVLREAPAQAARRPLTRKEWVPLAAAKPFDQTNGAVAFGTDGPLHGGRNVEFDMLQLGAAMNMIGFGGGVAG